MEISARLYSPCLSSVKPSFSDQSHLVFYGCCPSRLNKPIKSHLHTELASASHLAALPALRTAREPPLTTTSASNTCNSFPTTELDLLKELSDLKAQVKLKKKQLKVLAKQRKKAEKQKTAKVKCGSSSSSSSSNSSSESSDGERKAVNLRLLKKELPQHRELEQVRGARGETRGFLSGVDYTDMPPYKEEGGVKQTMLLRDYDSHRLFPNADEANVENMLPYDGPLRACQDEVSAGRSCGEFRAGHVGAISGNIKVCVGGKCKKAGSEQLLSSLKEKIPRCAQVDTMPCKCMGRCGLAINVKVQKQDTNPQHHSHVSVDDAGLILSHHFGLGPPPSGLPSFSSPVVPALSPSILTAQM